MVRLVSEKWSYYNSATPRVLYCEWYVVFPLNIDDFNNVSASWYILSVSWYILSMNQDTIFSICKNQPYTFIFKIFLNVTRAIYVEKCTLSNGVLKNKNGSEERDLGGKRWKLCLSTYLSSTENEVLRKGCKPPLIGHYLLLSKFSKNSF